MRFTIPLAWLQLSREKIRFIIALAGIAFAVILMFMQLGFQAALYDSAARFHQSLQGDLVLISSRSKSLGYMMPFSRRRLYQLLGIEGVASVSPVYVGFGDWKNPYEGTFRTIYVYGFDAGNVTIQLPEIQQNIDRIKVEQNILFDRASRSEYGAIAPAFERGESVTTELNGKRVNVVGLFTLGPSFGADGNLITSTANFLRLFPDRTINEVTIGLIQLQSAADVAAVQRHIAALLPNDIRILTHQEFIDFEKQYWQTSTAIGFIFTLGVGMGFIVGIVIVYQILYSDVSSHLAEYATLKAMGYRNSYLLNVVFQESIILAILGYIPGFLLSIFLYEMTKTATFLPLSMGLGRASFVLLLSLLMCAMSGAIAMRRLRQADPAEIF